MLNLTVTLLALGGLLAPAAASFTPAAPALPSATVQTTTGVGFGSGVLGSVQHASDFSLTDSAFGMHQVEVTSGHLHGGDVATSSGLDMAVTHDLIDSGQMLVDLRQIADNARIQAEAARRAKERQSASGGSRGGIALEQRDKLGTPKEWEMKNFSDCGVDSNSSHRGRIELVDLFEELCQDAEAAGIQLRINSSYRDPQYQLGLYRGAIAKYGSEKAARRWVAWSDGRTCSSRHCSGMAIDVNMGGDTPTSRWMHTVVGCATGTQVQLGPSSCSSGRAVKRVQLYGLIFPMSWEPWHLELGVPSGVAEGDGAGGGGGSSGGSGSCAPSSSTPVPQQVADIFRCRATQEGITGSERDRIAAEAVVVSKCESGWNTNAVVFGGKYTSRPHPRTGLRYTAAGVFQFIRASADGWIEGGYANVHDPQKNIDAAARYFLSNYTRGGRTAGWRPWACAAVNDGFASRSVLPGFPGGPSKLPSWAWKY